MHKMTWLAPDGRRYEVTVVKEPLERGRSIIFRCDDGWLGVAKLRDGEDLGSLMSDEIATLLV